MTLGFGKITSKNTNVTDDSYGHRDYSSDAFCFHIEPTQFCQGCDQL